MSSVENDLNSTKDELKWIVLTEEREKTGIERAWAKLSANPIVPIGALVTVGILGNGLYNLIKGNKKQQQLMMRYRCLAQGLTLVVACVSLFANKITK